ncbi:hydantoinase B/oxoprolinase family protein [Verticiella sediminum]|uniref:Hydantoinase B/oxoprolinase family protein n=1 Tax=Verticiella sediminum TaxID=1247510 RepID=A0A556ALW6_9BURK|nr:hydantoinase B/oxoprolinase family protein [Verticiella sediminum]TSH93890.1 hydantoinase B/oxoprolinase family protein [Verticiella sediminum]
MTLSNPRRHADAVLTEIVRNGVLAVTEEMKTNLMRTAYNMIIYEALDFTVGLFTAEGETISIGIGLPSFIRGMSNTIKAKLAYYAAPENGTIGPDDILVTNDAYITGSHLNHFTFSQPIFFDGKLSAWACCMAHWPDVGGALGGVTSDIYSEGIQIPVMKYRDNGRINDDLVRIIKTNVRLAERAMGDLRAQIIAVNTGHRRFTEILQRYGREPVLESISRIMDLSEAAARARTRSIPDGVYEAESFMDDDGLDIGSRVPIKVRVIKRGEEITVDLSEVSPQVRGFFNSGPSTGYSCAQVAYKCLTSPTDYPINEGSFRPLKVIVPEGTVVSASKPAAMRKWMTFPMTVVDTIFKAMASAIPDRTIAAHHADLVIALFHGLSPRDGKFFIGFVGPTGGGWGAKQNEDGMSGVVCSNDGDTHNSPCEQLEAKYPILIERQALRPDSGGAGRYRGGLGTETVVRARAPMSVDVQSDRMHCPPWGLDGGHAGLPNEVFVATRGEDPDDQQTGKVRNQRLRPGDRLFLRAGGGGGFGSPQQRDPEQVARDVRQGYVSMQNAREKYRVALHENGAVDTQATQALRAADATVE